MCSSPGADLPGNRWSHDRFVSYQAMLDTIRQRFPLEKLDDGPNDTSKVCRGNLGLLFLLLAHMSFPHLLYSSFPSFASTFSLFVCLSPTVCLCFTLCVSCFPCTLPICPSAHSVSFFNTPPPYYLSLSFLFSLSRRGASPGMPARSASSRP